MPDIATHYFFGDTALKQLPLKCLAPMDRAVFDTATAGPDTWFFKDFWHRLAPNDIANRMHKEGGSSLLTALLALAKEDAAKDELYSYVCGFLCHYLIDASTHPYINGRSADLGDHMRLERCIDHVAFSEWKDRGAFCITRRIFRLKKVGGMKNALDKAYFQVYGIPSAAEEMDKCIRNQRIFYVLAEDPTGLFGALLTAVGKKKKGSLDLSAISYHGKEHAAKDPMNLARAEWAPGRRESFDELRQSAVRKVIPLLEGVYSYLYENGAMPDLGELVG